MKYCVVSLGVDSGSNPYMPSLTRQNYSAGLNRIREDLSSVEFKGGYIPWKQYPPGSLPHEKSPFGFKPFCISDAVSRGVDLVMWVDSSVRIRQPIEPLFKMIEEEGHLLFLEDHSLGSFCKDDALTTLGIGREESFSLPCCWACVIGLNLKFERSAEFLRQWKGRSLDGTFAGAKWSGVKGFSRTVSDDPRVFGHRYDQTAASAIAIKLGMSKWKSKALFSWFFDNDREFVRSYQE
jgi:hypothetical protein